MWAKKRTHHVLTLYSWLNENYSNTFRITSGCQLLKSSSTSCTLRSRRYVLPWVLSASGKRCSARHGSSSSLPLTVCAILTPLHQIVPLILVGPNMLRFPVSLLTATAISCAIKRVIHRRLSLLKVINTTDHPVCACACHMELASPGGFSENTVPEHELTDAELAILGSMNAVLEDIREILGLSVVRNALA